MITIIQYSSSNFYFWNKSVFVKIGYKDDIHFVGRLSEKLLERRRALLSCFSHLVFLALNFNNQVSFLPLTTVNWACTSLLFFLPLFLLFLINVNTINTLHLIFISWTNLYLWKQDAKFTSILSEELETCRSYFSHLVLLALNSNNQVSALPWIISIYVSFG